MIATRLHHLLPTFAHPSRKLTIISIINYDKFQYVDNSQPPTAQLSPITNTLDTNKYISIGSTKSVNSGEKVVSEWGQYNIILKDGKKYKKHKWKNEPLKNVEDES